MGGVSGCQGDYVYGTVFRVSARHIMGAPSAPRQRSANSKMMHFRPRPLAIAQGR